MPDTDNPFVSYVAQKAPVNAPQPKSTVTQSSDNPFVSYLAQKGNTPTDSSATPQHGGLYQAANAVLNAKSPQADTGNGLLDKVANGIDYVGDQVAGLGQGALKGALSTAAGAGSIYNRVTGSNQPFNQDNLKELTVGHGPGQTIGKGAEQVGEFATGEGATAKALGVGGKIAASGGLSALQSGGDPLQTAIGTALPSIMSQPVVKKAGQFLSKFLGMTSGAGEGAISRAFLNPDSNGLAKVMRGDLDVNDVVGNLQKSVTAYRDAASADYSKQLNNITNTQIKNWPTKAGNFLSNIDTALGAELKKFNVVQGTNGEWDFKHLTGADPAEVKDLIQTVYSWGSNPRDLTPAGLDVLKKKLGEYADSGGSMKALGTRLYQQAKTNLDAIIPGYSQMTKNYADASDMLRKLKSEMSVSASANTNPGTISRKLQYLFKQGTDYREQLLKNLPNGDDILDQIAGLHLHDVMPRGLMKTLVGGETLYGMMHSPHLTAAAIPTAAVASPRVIGETARAAGKLAKSSVPVSDTLRRGILAGTNSQ